MDISACKGIRLTGSVSLDVDMTDAVNLREGLMVRWEKDFGLRLSLNHLVLKAAARVMKEHPELVGRIGGESQGSWTQVDLGVSILLEDRVITATLAGVDQLSLVDIASQVGRFYERAAEGRLVEEELSSATLIVTNLGKFGVDAATLIAETPVVPVLGLGRCAKRAIVTDEELAIRWVMTLNLTFDGASLDGPRAALLLAHIKDALERPTLLLQ